MAFLYHHFCLVLSFPAHTHTNTNACTSKHMYIPTSYQNTTDPYETYTLLSSRCLRSSSAQFWASIFSFTLLLLASSRALSLSCNSPITHLNFCISETGLNTPYHTSNTVQNFSFLKPPYAHQTHTTKSLVCCYMFWWKSAISGSLYIDT